MGPALLDWIARELAAGRSRRQVITTATRGVAGGLGTALAAGGIGADHRPAIARAQDATPQPGGAGASPPADTPFVRRSVHSLAPDGPELRAFASAIEIMKSWDTETTNPRNFRRSWRYLANMHMTPDLADEPVPDPFPPGWTTCEHGFFGPNRFFLPWHRLYLYWFERIVRELSGDPTFALPYWDYSDPAFPDRRILPAPFTDPASPLFVQARDSGVNAGVAPDPATVRESTFNFCRGLSSTSFDDASAVLESTPHGGIHVWVGGFFETPATEVPAGWMYYPDLAARDPVFWLHHANIDRLWESWLALGTTAIPHENPGDDPWLDNTTNVTGNAYAFFDEQGNEVTDPMLMTARGVQRSADLGYAYEELVGDLSMCPEFAVATPGTPEAGPGSPVATPTGPQELGGNAPAGGIEVGPDPAAVPVTLRQPEAATGAGTVVLTLDGIRSEGVPAVNVEVFINLPPDEQPDFRSPYYVGNLYLFGLLPAADDDGHGGARSQLIDITRNVRVLEGRGEWGGDLEVTFVPYYTAGPATGATPEAAGATPEAASPPAGPWVTVASVTVTVQ